MLRQAYLYLYWRRNPNKISWRRRRTQI